MKKTPSGVFRISLSPTPRRSISSGRKVYETWGVFRQSDGQLLDTAKARIGAVSKARKWSRSKGDCYVDKFVLP